MNNLRSLRESSKDLSTKQVVFIAAGAIALTAALAVVAEYYVYNNMEPAKDIGKDLGINNGSAEFHQDLQKGLVSLDIPAVDVMRSHGDK